MLAFRELYLTRLKRPSSISIMNILFIYIVEQHRKFADFIKKNCGFSKFSTNRILLRGKYLEFRSSINLPWRPKVLNKIWARSVQQSIYIEYRWSVCVGNPV